MKIMEYSDGMKVFYCPACNEHHGVNSGWTFNGDYERPTFSPSLLVRGIKLTEKGEAEYAAWSASGHPRRDAPFDSAPTVCHTFITDGRIQFLND